MFFDPADAYLEPPKSDDPTCDKCHEPDFFGDIFEDKFYCQNCIEEAKETAARIEAMRETHNHVTGRLCDRCGKPYTPRQDEPTCENCINKGAHNASN